MIGGGCSRANMAGADPEPCCVHLGQRRKDLVVPLTMEAINGLDRIVLLCSVDKRNKCLCALFPIIEFFAILRSEVTSQRWNEIINETQP